MNLEALLGELRENVLRDDAELASGPNDFLWSDETLVRYINEAQRKFARKTLLLRDASTPEVAQVTLRAGVSSYVLHDRVLAVVSAKYDTDSVDLGRVGRAAVTTLWYYEPPFFDPSQATALTPGRPRAFSTDETLDVDSQQAITLVVYPTPTATEEGKIIYLRTCRMPMSNFDINDLKAECELNEDYHLDMLEYAAFLALRNSDIDGHSAQSAEHEKRFTDAVEEALKDVRRKMRVPLRWQFGAGGFTWETV